MKTERDIEARLGIKVENPYTRRSTTERTHQVFHDTSSPALASPNAHTDLCANKKKKLIENILTLKSENHTLGQKLNEKDAEMKTSKKIFEEKVQELILKLDESKKQLMNASQANEKCVSDLKRDNVLLAAQNKQLKTGLNQAEIASKSDG